MVEQRPSAAAARRVYTSSNHPLQGRRGIHHRRKTFRNVQAPLGLVLFWRRGCQRWKRDGPRTRVQRSFAFGISLCETHDVSRASRSIVDQVEVGALVFATYAGYPVERTAVVRLSKVVVRALSNVEVFAYCFVVLECRTYYAYHATNYCTLPGYHGAVRASQQSWSISVCIHVGTMRTFPHPK